MIRGVLLLFIILNGAGCQEKNMYDELPTGSIVAWGLDENGQVSHLPEGDDYVAVSAGNRQSLALRQNGSLASWGYDSGGQVSDTPEGNDFIAISAGHNFSLA